MNRPSPDDMKAMQVVDYVTELEMENKKLKEKLDKKKSEFWYGFNWGFWLMLWMIIWAIIAVAESVYFMNK